MLPIRRRLYQSLAGFTPRQLFAALQGAWLEPTPGFIWQENTGVTPTTTGGQTIGRVADLSGWGNNATQATAANRPVLGRRYNRLTYSETFGSGWAMGGVSGGSTTPATLYNGLGGYTITATSAREYYTVTLSAIPAGTYTLSAYGQSGSGATPAIGIFGTTTSINASLFSSPTRLSVTFSYAGGDIVVRVGIGLTGNATGTITIGGLMLNEGSTALPYQRITTATDYDVGQYPAAVHDTTDSLSVSLPNLNGGVFSASGSVYFATPVGMSSLHNQSMGTTFTLPALSSDIYSWIVVPQRLSAVQETRLGRYMLRKAGLALPDYLTDDAGEILTDDIGDPLLAG